MFAVAVGASGADSVRRIIVGLSWLPLKLVGRLSPGNDTTTITSIRGVFAGNSGIHIERESLKSWIRLADGLLQRQQLTVILLEWGGWISQGVEKFPQATTSMSSHCMESLNLSEICRSEQAILLWEIVYFPSFSTIINRQRKLLPELQIVCPAPINFNSRLIARSC